MLEMGILEGDSHVISSSLIPAHEFSLRESVTHIDVTQNLSNIRLGIIVIVLSIKTRGTVID